MPNFSVRIYLNELRKRFAKFFPRTGNKKDIDRHRQNCYNRAVVSLARAEGNADADYQTVLKAGRQIISRRLMAGETPKDLAGELIQTVYALHLNPDVVPNTTVYHIQHPEKPHVHRQLITGRTGKTSRQRVHWTPVEDELLIATRADGKF